MNIDDAASPQFFREEHLDMYSPTLERSTCCQKGDMATKLWPEYGQSVTRVICVISRSSGRRLSRVIIVWFDSFVGNRLKTKHVPTKWLQVSVQTVKTSKLWFGVWQEAIPEHDDLDESQDCWCNTIHSQLEAMGIRYRCWYKSRELENWDSEQMKMESKFKLHWMI